MLKAVLTFLLGIGRDWLADWQANREQQRDLKKTIKLAQIERVKEAAKNKNLWELRALEKTPGAMRWLSYSIVTLPILCAVFAPSWVERGFMNALTVIPEWWWWTWGCMHAAIWGVSELRNLQTWKN